MLTEDFTNTPRGFLILQTCVRMARRASSRGSGARRNRAEVKKKKEEGRKESKEERERGGEKIGFRNRRKISEGGRGKKAENIFIRRILAAANTLHGWIPFFLINRATQKRTCKLQRVQKELEKHEE